MSSDEELRQVMEEAARELSRLSSNPRTWVSWLIYFMNSLEEQANRESTSYGESYREMLSAFEEAIRNRRRTGGW